MNNYTLTEVLNARLTTLSWEERLHALCEQADKHIVFSTSFSLEDQVITDCIARATLPIRVFTLDTGRLFEETYTTFQQTKDHYPDLPIHTYFPDAESVEALILQQGINGFYNSVENRLACCHVRKVEPLERALSRADIWISGLRRSHSVGRESLPVAEYDDTRDIIKVYPLIDMDDTTLRRIIDAYHIPYNPLQDQGFPSVGCQPCTRAVKEGEDMRAGRWWWEQQSAQECGLHLKDGKLVRKADNHAE